jgi:hypothetical protein
MALALVFATSAAGAAAPTVTLRLSGAHGKLNRVCSKEKHPALRPASQVKRNAALKLLGLVKPAPARAGWNASLVVKRCGAAGPGEYKKVWVGQAAGTRAGTFSSVYTPRLPGLYYALAMYGHHPSTDSTKLYFVAS